DDRGDDRSDIFCTQHLEQTDSHGNIDHGDQETALQTPEQSRQDNVTHSEDAGGHAPEPEHPGKDQPVSSKHDGECYNFHPWAGFPEVGGENPRAEPPCFSHVHITRLPVALGMVTHRQSSSITSRNFWP